MWAHARVDLTFFGLDIVNDLIDMWVWFSFARENGRTDVWYHLLEVRFSFARENGRTDVWYHLLEVRFSFARENGRTDVTDGCVVSLLTMQ